MTRRLLLHIGSHKTGTTTIQHTLMANNEALAEQGVRFATPEGRPTLHRTLGPVSQGSTAELGFRVQNEPLMRATFLDAAPQQNMISSSENFSFFFQPEYIEDLANILRDCFDEVTILVYLRRQDSHVISHHQEGAKVNRRAEEEVFGCATTAIPWDGPALDQYLDYNTRIGYWLDIFGEKNVVARVFDRESLVKGDVWYDFIDVAGLDPTGLETQKDFNVSFGLTKAKIGHMMNANGLPEELRNQVLNALPDDARQMPSRADAVKFYDRYKAGNIALNARLGAAGGSDIFPSDFSSYPEESRELWTEKSATDAITALISLVGASHGQLGADDLRNAAQLADKAGNLELALALIREAAHQRPHGPIIQKRLAEYEAKLPKKAPA